MKPIRARSWRPAWRRFPPKSPYGHVIADVLAWSKQYPDDWQKVWQLVEEKWDKREPCPEGALRPFNIDAKLNGAYVALGLLYGNGDFGKTIEVSTRAGQDSDCNPSSAGGILGVMLGYKAIPEEWKSGIPAIADKKFNYTDFTFHTIVDSTEKRAARADPEDRRPHRRRQGLRQYASAQSAQTGSLERLWQARRTHRRG